QVPEGFYTVQPTAMNPKSRYHLSFNIGYPNIFDLEHQRTGSAIMVHGNQVSSGCLAMTDEKIEEIYTLCAAAHRTGQVCFKIDIFPARMTDGWMDDARGNLNEKFWQNLKEGYDIFERNHVPPEVSVAGGRYQFQ
ncbi:MAG: L,D-transpeptidase family protein, partial [Akkermansiaceae bacterium]|nr:L,D-transpeptidase family protein [Akkermansiaceae bacterium]